MSCLPGHGRDGIAYKGSRTNVGKILRRSGLMKSGDHDLSRQVDHLISDRAGAFHFGSLIRCSVERYDRERVDRDGRRHAG